MAKKRGRPPGSKTRRPRPAKLPGMEDVTIQEIDDAAADYVDCRDTRMRNLKSEIEASERLLDVMNRHGVKDYRYDGKVVKVLSKTKVSVKRIPDEDSNDDHVEEE